MISKNYMQAKTDSPVDIVHIGTGFSDLGKNVGNMINNGNRLRLYNMVNTSRGYMCKSNYYYCGLY